MNRKDDPGHDAGLQRHHLLPFQLITAAALRPLVEAVGLARLGFDDFRRNGLLLPATDQAAQLLRLPLHRGPHRAYNEMVLERVGRIEAHWSRERMRSADGALETALLRLSLLQGALRRRLLAPQGRGLVLNRRDPALSDPRAFAELDAMADLLWAETAEVA